MSLPSFPPGGVAVVIGASGGIGQALARQLEASSAFTQVLAFSRRGDPPVDITSEDQLAAAARLVEAAGPLRLAILATGVLQDGTARAEKSWRELDPVALAHVFQVNAIGPALAAKHLLPLMPRQGKAVFAALSARVGSIGDNRLGGWYGYRASKAALNQILRTAAIELRRRAPDAVCLALHPGTVDTGLSRPFPRAGLDVQTPDEAAARLLAVIDAAGPDQSGAFLDHRGEPAPW